MNAQTKPIHTIIDQNVVNIFTIIFANINIGRSNYPLKQNQGSWDLLGPVKVKTLSIPRRQKLDRRKLISGPRGFG